MSSTNRTYPSWQTWEDALLKEEYKKNILSIKLLAQKLNRTIGSVRTRAHTLQLGDPLHIKHSVFNIRGSKHPATKQVVCKLCEQPHYAKGLCCRHYKNINPLRKYPKTMECEYRGHNSRNIERAKQYHKYECKICKSKKNIVLHHIDGNAYNNQPSNWKFLCASCHKYIHSIGFVPNKNQKIAIQYERQRSKYLESYPIKVAPFLVKNNIPNGYVMAIRATQILGISRERLRQLRNQGVIKFTKYKKSFLYEKQSIDERIAKSIKAGRPKIFLK